MLLNWSRSKYCLNASVIVLGAFMSGCSLITPNPATSPTPESSSPSSTASLAPTISYEPNFAPIVITLYLDDFRLELTSSGKTFNTPIGSFTFNPNFQISSQLIRSEMKTDAQDKRLLSVSIDGKVKTYEIEKNQEFKINVEQKCRLYEQVQIEGQGNKNEDILIVLKSIQDSRCTATEDTPNDKPSPTKTPLAPVDPGFNAETINPENNCRFGPGISYKVKEVLKPGQILVDRAKPSTDDKSDTWFREEYLNCWVHYTQIRLHPVEGKNSKR